MNPFQVENTELFDRSAIGKTRLFIKVANYYGFTAEHPFVYQGLAEVTPPTPTRGEPTTAELPHDSDGGTTVEVTTGLGSYEKITGTITQPMSQHMQEGYWSIFRLNRPFAMWLPNGASRELDNPNDYASGWLVDRCYVNSVGPDNNANPRDRTTVNEWFTLSIEYACSSADVNVLRPASFASESGLDEDDKLGAVDVRENAIGTNILVASSEVVAAVGTGSATSGNLWFRTYGESWKGPINVTTKADADAGALSDAAFVGSYAMVVGNTDGVHGYIPVADLEKGSGSLTLVSGYNASGKPNAIYAPSPGFIIVVGDGGYVYKLTSVFNKPVTKSAGTASTEKLVAVDGLKSQIVAVGENNAVIRSSDFGETWSAATGPSGTATDDVSAVAVVEQDIFLVATSQGKVFRTDDFGTTFTEVSLGFTIASINAMVFRRNEVNQSLLGHLVGHDGTNGVVARTIDAGATWSAGSDHIPNKPASKELVDLAVCNNDPNKVICVGFDSSDEGFIMSS